MDFLILSSASPGEWGRRTGEGGGGVPERGRRGRGAGEGEEGELGSCMGTGRRKGKEEGVGELKGR